MKIVVTTILAILNTSHFSKAQNLPHYEIAKWFQFKNAAVTYTMDDNCTNQLDVAIPIFNEFGFKSTIYVVTGWGINWKELKHQSSIGHEIASHSVTHKPLEMLSSIEQTVELVKSRKTIESNLKNYSCQTIAYPYCNIGNKSLISKQFIAGRICGGCIEESSPQDFYNISSVICGTQGTVLTDQDFNDSVQIAKQKQKWCVFLIHDIDNNKGHSSISSKYLRSHLEFVNNNSRDYWVGTFKDVVKYIRERDSATIQERLLSDNCIQVFINDTLNNLIYNHPLTIRRKLPKNWEGASVYIDDDLIPSYQTNENLDKYITFNAVPDGRKIFVVNSMKNLSEEIDSSNVIDFETSPNPFFEHLTLVVKGEFSYVIYTPNGKTAEKGYGHSILKIGGNLVPGSYILFIDSPSGKLTSHILKK